MLTVLAVLALGGALGVAASWLDGERPRGPGVARPVVAASPSVPVDPPPELEPDPTEPPLATGVRLEEQQLGGDAFPDTVLAPVGWERTDSLTTEAKWVVPGYPKNTYGLRIEQVHGQRQSAAAILANRIRELDSAAGIDDLAILDRTADSLEFTYVETGYLRHGLLRWLDLDGSEAAELEIAVTGRESDVPGMRDLLERVAQGSRD